MKPNKKQKMQKEKEINKQKEKPLEQKFNLNKVLVEKLKKLKKDNINRILLFDNFQINKGITTSQKHSKNNYSIAVDFNNYNFSNLNNIRKIYLKNNSYFSTEIDHKYFNKRNNKISKEQNEINEKNKFEYNYKNNTIKKALEPIYEFYNPSKVTKYGNIYKNYLNMNRIPDFNYIKSRYQSPNQLRFKNNNNNKEYSYLQKYKNYFPYIEKLKKIRASNSNDKIFLTHKYNNTSRKNRIISLNDYYHDNNSYTYNSPLRKDVEINNKNKTTYHRYNLTRKDIEIKARDINSIQHKELNLRTYFGDNYNYFERNESPIKVDKTFHNRRSPAHVFGWEKYFIIEDSNDRLFASCYPYNSINRRLNSEENYKKYHPNNFQENNKYPIYEYI